MFLACQGPLQDLAPALLDYSLQSISTATEVAVFCGRTAGYGQDS